MTLTQGELMLLTGDNYSSLPFPDCLLLSTMYAVSQDLRSLTGAVSDDMGMTLMRLAYKLDVALSVARRQGQVTS